MGGFQDRRENALIVQVITLKVQCRQFLVIIVLNVLHRVVVYLVIVRKCKNRCRVYNGLRYTVTRIQGMVDIIAQVIIKELPILYLRSFFIYSLNHK
uniref:Transcription factor GLABRA 3-like isoform X1 n=1 Tax=Rhizophora mucronata TaxID=61149 RepID=A0A2P2PMW5_RHIMU